MKQRWKKNPLKLHATYNNFTYLQKNEELGNYPYICILKKISASQLVYFYLCYKYSNMQ